MRILHVITDTDRRGAQVFALDLQAALQARRHTNKMLALAPGIASGGLDVEVLGPRRYAASTLRALRAASRQVEVVVAHGSSTLPACGLALAGASTPFVYRQISDSLFWADSRWRRARVRLGLSRAAAVVALSARSAAVLTAHFGVPTDRLSEIPNGVPEQRHQPASPAARSSAREALGLDPRQRVVAVLAALTPEKGVDLAIDAIGRVPDAQLVVAGDGPERTRLEDQARRGDRPVHFLGSLADPAIAYEAADCVLLCPRGGDTMPAVLIEAGLRGLACVVTDVGAITDVVVDGETGRVVTADPREIADGLRDVLDRTEVRSGLGEEARQRALSRFEIGAVAAQWEAVLDTVVNPAPT